MTKESNVAATRLPIETAPAATARKPQQTASITLTAHGSTMLLLAVLKSDGTTATTVTTTDAEKHNVRGMTETHQSMSAAQAHLAKLALQAEKQGWARRGAGRGFVAKPDAFATLPAPPKAAAPAPAPKIKK